MDKKVLIVDVGNSAIKFAVFKDGNFQEFLGFFHFPSQIKDAKKALTTYKKSNDHIDGGMIFSVAPRVNDLVQNLIEEVFGLKLSIFDWKDYQLQKKNPLIKEPIGADLLADIKQAEKEYGGPILVADFGTITKLIYLDNNSYFDGLSFIPGIEVAIKLFSQNTAFLPEVTSLNIKKNRLGLNTIESMNHGVYYSTIYYVKDVFKSLGNKDCKLVLTGGNLRFVKDEFKDHIIDSNFTLKGMYVLYEESKL